ncbi:MAG: phenylacetate--CoA ligase family protein, partial [Candidatus Odinarchaeota archaeon]
IKSFDDLKKLPFLTKEIIKENYNDLISSTYPKNKRIPRNTGGTSGDRLYFLESFNCGLIEWAFITTIWGRVGFKPSDCRISIGDVPIVQNKENQLWQYDPLRKEWRLSPFHLSLENLPRYLEKIRDAKCRYIHGFVSSLTIIAKFILDHNYIDLPPFNAILASSETIYDWQRELIENAFKTRLFSWYGQNEKVILASECEVNQEYHILPEYGYAEVVRPDGTQVKSGHELGALVGTGFYNYAMPFIRYKLDDWGQIEEKECKCGRSHNFLINLKAKRIVNMIVAKQKYLISALAINLRSGIFINIERFQFYQDKVGELILKIVKGINYKLEDTQRILKELNNQLGDAVDIKVIFVDKIPLTECGKQKVLEQKLNVDLLKKLDSQF